MFVCVAVFLCLGGAYGQKPELITEEGHTSNVRSIAFSPNGKLIASGSEDKKIKLWDVDAGMELRSMGGNGGTITSLVFADDRTLVSGDDYGNVKLWNIARGEEIITLERAGCHSRQSCLTGLALSDDRKTLAVAGKGEVITFWDIPSRREVNRLTAQQLSVKSLAFASSAGLLATAVQDGTILIWNIADSSRKTLYKSNDGAEVSSVAFSPDGKYLVGGSQDNFVRVWSVENNELMNAWAAHEGGVNCVIYNQDGGSIISGGNDNNIKIWKGYTGAQLLPALKHKLKIRAVASSPSGDLVTGGGNDSSVTLWNARNGNEIKKWEPHTFFVKDIVFSPKGNILATAHWKTVKLWNVATGRELRTFRKLDGWIFSLAFNDDGSKLASCSGENGTYEVNVWDVASGKELLRFKDTMAYSVAFSRDGKLLAGSDLGGSPSIRLWDATGGQLLRGWQITPSTPVRSIAFDANGLLVSGCDDGVIRVWDVNKESPVKTIVAGIGPIVSVDVSADGSMLAGRGSYQAKIWDLRTWQESPVRIPVSLYEGGMRFSPDGTMLAVGEYMLSDKRETIALVRLWKVSNGELLKSMTGHQNGVTSVAFSRDGSRIVSGSWDNTWKLWSVDSERELCTVIALDESDWVAVTPEGRFDASSKGMELMHWRIGDELISLSQLKDQYWEPGLLAKLLLLNKEPFVTNTEAFNDVKLFPKIEYDMPAPGSTKLTLKLTNRGGGIGKVQVKVNNTEVYEDARGPGFDANKNEAIIPIDFANAPIVRGQTNTIQVTAWNVDGYLSSRRLTREWIPEGDADKSPPEFYALVVGISEYSHPDIRLKYSAKDAEAMAGALELGAKRLFPGAGRVPNQSRVHVNLLRTSDDPGAVPPTKENIKKAFEAMKTALPQDVVVVYLSGHGVALQGGSAAQGSGLYCFLTKEARSKYAYDYSDPALVEQRTITSREFAAWIRPVRALRRVMILDTCAAGAAAKDFGEKGDDISAYQLRAIDKFNDRTGFFVLMGSAADSVSYEATQYAQSLLTYALLRKMKIEKDVPDEIQVASLFQYAVDEVPQLALGNNGIQKPEIKVPQGGASFPIGLLTKEDKGHIKAQSPKPVILRPTFINPAARTDNLKLAAALRKRLDEETYVRAKGSTFQADIVYVDADGLQGAYSPSGIYTIEANQVNVEMVLIRESNEIRFEVTGFKDNLDELVSRIMDAIYQKVETPKN